MELSDSVRSADYLTGRILLSSVSKVGLSLDNMYHVLWFGPPGHKGGHLQITNIARLADVVRVTTISYVYWKTVSDTCLHIASDVGVTALRM